MTMVINTAIEIKEHYSDFVLWNIFKILILFILSIFLSEEKEENSRKQT